MLNVNFAQSTVVVGCPSIVGDCRRVVLTVQTLLRRANKQDPTFL